MPTILFNEIIFGPVRSRRLGVSLGVNLLPVNGKVCTFDCIYCECGFNQDGKTSSQLPSAEKVKEALEKKLKKMKEAGDELDVITFAGNGEPTLHSEFSTIIDDTIELRDRYFPAAKVSVLSNATMIRRESVFAALKKVENNILKIDTPFDGQLHLIDRPVSSSFQVRDLVEQIKRFEGNVIIQTMFLTGEYEGKRIDNTSDEEITAWIEILKEINPKQVMIYTIERETPAKSLQKVSLGKLNQIADKVRREGFSVSVSG